MNQENMNHSEQETKQTISPGEDTAQTAGKKSKKPLFIILAILLILVVGGVFAYQYVVGNSPAMMLYKSQKQLENAKTLVMEGDMSMKFAGNIEGEEEQTKAMSELISNMGFGLKLEQDMQNKRVYADVSINYNQTPMMGAEFYADQQKAGLNVPLALNQWVYTDYETLSQELKEKTGIQVTVKDYLKYFDQEYYRKNFKNLNEKEMYRFMFEKFKDKFKKEPKEEVEIRGEMLKLQPISLSLNFEDLISFMDEYMKKFGEKGQNLNVTLIQDVVETAKGNGDFETWNVSEADLQKMYEEMETAYDPEAFSKILSGKEFQSAKENMKIEYQYKFYLDGGHNMRKISFVAAVEVKEKEQVVKADVTGDFDLFANEKLKETYFDEAQSYHIIHDLEEIQGQAMQNVFVNMMKLYGENEGFQKMMDSFGGFPMQ